MRFTDYYPDVAEITPLWTGERFRGKIKVSFGDESIPHQFLPFEVYGMTWQDAEQKAKQRAREWIAKNGRRVEPKVSSQDHES